MENIPRELAPFLDNEGRLTALPAKNKKKLMALWYLSGKIEAGQRYTEARVNDMLDRWTTFHDPATLRRELYNKHLLNRTPDCTQYWRENEILPLADFIAKYSQPFR